MWGASEEQANAWSGQATRWFSSDWLTKSRDADAPAGDSQPKCRSRQFNMHTRNGFEILPLRVEDTGRK